jgi:hypothetical protein
LRDQDRKLLWVRDLTKKMLHDVDRINLAGRDAANNFSAGRDRDAVPPKGETDSMQDCQGMQRTYSGAPARKCWQLHESMRAC